MSEKIIVGTDGSGTAGRAVDEALRLAVALAAELHVVEREPADALLRLAEELGASMIVIGNKGMSGGRKLLGSVPNKVSHEARCNVLIVATR